MHLCLLTLVRDARSVLCTVLLGGEKALFFSIDSNTCHKYLVLASFLVKGECLNPLLTSGIFEGMRQRRDGRFGVVDANVWNDSQLNF